MPAHIIQNNEGNSKKSPKTLAKAQVKAPKMEATQNSIAMEMEAVLAESSSKPAATAPAQNSSLERAEFYAGRDRLNLQGESVQRVRELQVDNDNLQREIFAKEENIRQQMGELIWLPHISLKILT